MKDQMPADNKRKIIYRNNISVAQFQLLEDTKYVFITEPVTGKQ